MAVCVSMQLWPMAHLAVLLYVCMSACMQQTCKLIVHTLVPRNLPNAPAPRPVMPTLFHAMQARAAATCATSTTITNPKTPPAANTVSTGLAVHDTLHDAGSGAVVWLGAQITLRFLYDCSPHVCMHAAYQCCLFILCFFQLNN